MLAEALHLALTGFGIVAATMFALWLVHLRIRNAAIVDVGWAAGLAMLAIFYAVEGPGYCPPSGAAWNYRRCQWLGFGRWVRRKCHL